MPKQLEHTVEKEANKASVLRLAPKVGEFIGLVTAFDSLRTNNKAEAIGAGALLIGSVILDKLTDGIK